MEVFNNPLLFTVIFCLSINVVVTIFGFFNIRNMRGRWIIGAVQILMILFVLFAPSFEGKLIVPSVLLTGSASVLFSRTLTYMVKPIKTKVILWILTILFSIFAPVLFALLILAILFRFSLMGEEGIGILLVAFLGMFIVASLAFVVNIRELYLYPHFFPNGL